MPKPRVPLKVCDQCGIVRVETLTVAPCPVCRVTTVWTEIEVDEIHDGSYVFRERA